MPAQWQILYLYATPGGLVVQVDADADKDSKATRTTINFASVTVRGLTIKNVNTVLGRYENILLESRLAAHHINVWEYLESANIPPNSGRA